MPPEDIITLAVKGETLIKKGEIEEGIEYLEKALGIGTDNLLHLSAIYNQLGNAYFTIQVFDKAQLYMMYDHTLAKLLKNRYGEAQAAANISSLHKSKREYDSAARYAQIQLNIGKELKNQNVEAAAYYNLGTIYHFKGKEAGLTFKAATSDINFKLPKIPGDPCDFKADILQAIENNLIIVEGNDDRRSAGMTYGNLGNCHYLLKNFDEAIDFHRKRLQVAQEFGDKETQRRAYLNLGNAYVFKGDLTKALECYRLALSLAMDLDPKKPANKAIQGQVCFSLASASTIAEDYQMAVEYHLKHLAIARSLKDVAGEARAHASLGTNYRLIGDYPKATYFMARRRSIAKQIRDTAMVHSAERAFRELIELAGNSIIQDDRELIMDSSADPEAHRLTPLRLSASLQSIHDAGDFTNSPPLSRRNVFRSDGELSARPSAKSARSMTETQEDFFEFLSRVQSKRMDEQRCAAPILNDISNRPPRQRDSSAPSPNESLSSNGSKRFSTLKKHFTSGSLFSIRKKNNTSKPSSRRNSLCSVDIPPIAPPRRKRDGPDALIDALMQAQGRRMDEQRANLFPGLQGREDLINKIHETAELEGGIDEQLLEMVAHAQGQRMNEQRSELGGRNKDQEKHTEKSVGTLPEDDLSELVATMARSRLDDQRASMPTKNEDPSTA